MAAESRRPSAWTHYLALVKKDLAMELHTKDMITSMGLYSILVLVIYGAALSQGGTSFDFKQLSGGLIWAVILFTSLLGLNRSFVHERENGCLEGTLLVPMDRSVIFLAKATANLFFLLVVEVIVVPLFFFWFSSLTLEGVNWLLVVVCLLVGTVGIAGVGTMLSTITASTRGKDVLLAIMFIPLLFPLLWSVVAATTALVCMPEGFMDAFVISISLAGGYDVVMILVSWLLYDFVVSA